MATLVMVVGSSGTGKTTSARTLDPKKTFFINCDQKDLPFKGWISSYSKEKGNYASTSNTEEIKDVLRDIVKNKKGTETIVIDTLNRIMTDKVMKERGITGFQKWTDLSGCIYDLISIVNKQLPEYLTVFALFHEEAYFNDDGIKIRRIATEGKQLSRMSIESMGSIVLFTTVKHSGKGEPNKYNLQTQTDGQSTAKSPMGMFDNFEIPNDFQEVLEKIEQFKK